MLKTTSLALSLFMTGTTFATENISEVFERMSDGARRYVSESTRQRLEKNFLDTTSCVDIKAVIGGSTKSENVWIRKDSMTTFFKDLPGNLQYSINISSGSSKGLETYEYFLYEANSWDVGNQKGTFIYTLKTISSSSEKQMDPLKTFSITVRETDASSPILSSSPVISRGELTPTATPSTSETIIATPSTPTTETSSTDSRSSSPISTDASFRTRTSSTGSTESSGLSTSPLSSPKELMGRFRDAVENTMELLTPSPSRKNSASPSSLPETKKADTNGTSENAKKPAAAPSSPGFGLLAAVVQKKK